MDDVVAVHGGIVDKRIGDGMMVVFVAVERPRSAGDLAASAIRCGLAMLARLTACNAELVQRGGEPMAIRVGVAAGNLVQGNIGSRDRMEYTVIGEPVNLAARLESAADENCLLTTPDCLAALPELLVTAVPRRISAKGFGVVDAVQLRP